MFGDVDDGDPVWLTFWEGYMGIEGVGRWWVVLCEVRDKEGSDVDGGMDPGIGQ